MTAVTAIPGAEELVGRGVYLGMPDDIPLPVRGRHAVVTGESARCTMAARQLGDVGWKVTVVTSEQRCTRAGCRRCRSRLRTEVVCATGIEYLEALVLRNADSGRIDALNASALFVL